MASTKRKQRARHSIFDFLLFIWFSVSQTGPCAENNPGTAYARSPLAPSPERTIVKFREGVGGGIMMRGSWVGHALVMCW